MKSFRTAAAALFACVVSVSGSGASHASSFEIQKAEQEFWAAAKRTENTGIISAYLLHFSDGRFAENAANLFQKATGQTWTKAVADQTAWRNIANDAIVGLTDRALSGRWTHRASCDVNFFVKDVEGESEQTFRVSAAGVMNGESTFRSGNSFEGGGQILELRRSGSVVTYLMAAQNSLTGGEVHIGILNLRQENGRFLTRGWEMNTGGAYCDLAGEKVG